MKIVIDTNVLISGIFFGGFPQKVIDAVMQERCSAYATADMVAEYREIVAEMIERKQGHLRRDLLLPLLIRLHIIEGSTQVNICRDPDDNKFIECAISANASYIVSGDKDLLDIVECNGINIVTPAEFCKLLNL